MAAYQSALDAHWKALPVIKSAIPLCNLSGVDAACNACSWLAISLLHLPAFWALLIARGRLDEGYVILTLCQVAALTSNGAELAFQASRRHRQGFMLPYMVLSNRSELEGLHKSPEQSAAPLNVLSLCPSGRVMRHIARPVPAILLVRIFAVGSSVPAYMSMPNTHIRALCLAATSRHFIMSTTACLATAGMLFLLPCTVFNAIAGCCQHHFELQVSESLPNC